MKINNTKIYFLCPYRQVPYQSDGDHGHILRSNLTMGDLEKSVHLNASNCRWFNQSRRFLTIYFLKPNLIKYLLINNENVIEELNFEF